MATQSEQTAGRPPAEEANQLLRPSISTNCEDPAPEAPFGKGKEAIKTDKNGKAYDSVYGVRPPTTWHLKPRKEMNLWEFIASLDLVKESQPNVNVYQRKAGIQRGPPPKLSSWSDNAFIITFACFPLLVHSAIYSYYWPDHKPNPIYAWSLYHLWFMVFAFAMLKRLHHYMNKYGCFGEQDRGRDLPDDKHVNHLGRAISIYTVFRSLGVFLFCWRGDINNPIAGLSWATPFKIGAWEIVFDLFFYVYHRSCHEFDSLWFIHRQHHATKYPTPVLSILADDIQEIIEIFACPFLATTACSQLKFSFAELWLVAFYALYVEASGHSGIRAEWKHPILGVLLSPLGMDLQIEDHDLHHRFGKSGRNYGKQTRIWDRLFSTIGERVETTRTGFGQRT